jgi:hypothetical protein
MFKNFTIIIYLNYDIINIVLKLYTQNLQNFQTITLQNFALLGSKTLNYKVIFSLLQGFKTLHL